MGTNINLNPFSILDNMFGFSEKKQQKREDEVAQRNYNQAKEFAQNSMQWKAEDLRKAGINPIYAMGAGGYSAPVSSTSPVNLGTAGSVGFTKEDKDIKKATANEIQARANKTNAEAKSVQTIEQGIKKATDSSTDYTYLQGVDGVNRPYMSQDVSEALENDLISRIGWHGRGLMRLHGSQLEEFRNNLWNSLLQDKKIDPFKHDIIVNPDRSYIVVPRDSKQSKVDKWEKVEKPKYMRENFSKAIKKDYLRKPFW